METISRWQGVGVVPITDVIAVKVKCSGRVPKQSGVETWIVITRTEQKKEE